MLTKWSRLIVIIACGLTLASCLPAANLEYIASRASAIVVGTITTRVETPTQVSFTINVNRVLAGTVPGQTVDVVHPRSMGKVLVSPSTYTLDQSISGMWFLTAGVEPGKWDVIGSRPGGGPFASALVLPALPTAPTGRYSYPATTPLLEILAYEIAAGVEATGDDPGVYWGAFFTMDNPAIRMIFANCLASVNLESQTVGLAGSLERGAARISAPAFTTLAFNC